VTIGADRLVGMVVGHYEQNVGPISGNKAVPAHQQTHDDKQTGSSQPDLISRKYPPHGHLTRHFLIPSVEYIILRHQQHVLYQMGSALRTLIDWVSNWFELTNIP
jgi:hypothetical protein